MKAAEPQALTLSLQIGQACGWEVWARRGGRGFSIGIHVPNRGYLRNPKTTARGRECSFQYIIRAGF